MKNEGSYCFTIEGLKKDEDLRFVPLDPPVFQNHRIIYKKSPFFSRAGKIFLSYLKESVLKTE